MYIQYGHCGSTNRVAYNTYLVHKRRGQRNFTVNTKLGTREVDTEAAEGDTYQSGTFLSNNIIVILLF